MGVGYGGINYVICNPPKDPYDIGIWKLQDMGWRSLGPTPDVPDVFLSNDTYALFYTTDDFLKNKPLPDPYPYKDYGPGLTWPGPEYRSGHYFAPIADNTRFLFQGSIASCRSR